MILPKMVTDDPDLYFKTLFTVIVNMGHETTRLLRQILVSKQPLTPPDRTKCNAWVKYWTAYVVAHHYTTLGKIMSLPIGPNNTVVRVSATACMMWELWRLKLILSYHLLPQLKTWKIKDSPFLVKWLIDTPGIELDQKPLEPEKESAKAGPKALAKYEEALAKYHDEMDKFRGSKMLSDTAVLLFGSVYNIAH